MATLRVRGIPDELYQQLQNLARDGNRSLSAQVVLLLDEGVRLRRLRREQKAVLEDIRRRRFVTPPGAPPSAELLREDRER